MTVTSVNGAPQPQRPTEAQLKARLAEAEKMGDQSKIDQAKKELQKFYDLKAKENPNAGTEVERTKRQPGDEEAAKASAQANEKAVEEVAEMKKQAQEAAQLDRNLDSGEIIYTKEGREAIRSEAEKLDTKEEVEAAGFKHKTKKLAKAARHIGERAGNVDNVEKIFTNKEEYKKAVEEAKKDGTWDKKHPKYTLLDGKALEGAKKMAQDAKKNIEQDLATYNKFKAVYENAKNDVEKQNAFTEMVDAAKRINNYYDASQMFDENGEINKDAYQRTMIRYTGGDFKGNLDERKVLADDADVSKGKAKDMLKAGGLDVEKDYTWAMRGGALAFGLGTGGLIGLLGGGAVATAVATAVGATASTVVTNNNYTTDITGPNGEHYLDRQSTSTTVTTTGATDPVVDTATKTISKGQQALRGLYGAIPAALLSAILTKDNGGRDVFNGASVEQVLANAKLVRGKENQELVQKIIDIPNDKLTPRQKAAIIYATMGDATGKKVNTEELMSGYLIAKYLESKADEEPPAPVQQPTVDPPTPPAPPVEPEPRAIERTDDIPERKIDKDYNVRHRSGMGPYQYAEALGVPAKYRMEFVRQFQKDNNLNRTGKLYNKTPLLQMEYTFKDGTTFSPGTKEEAQEKIDKYNLGKVEKPKDNKGKDISGKQKSVQGRPIRFVQIPGQKGYWIYTDTKERVPGAELKKHPTYIDYVNTHGHD